MRSAPTSVPPTQARERLAITTCESGAPRGGVGARYQGRSLTRPASSIGHAVHMFKADAPPTIRIVIDLERDSDPIEGTLLEPEFHASSFRGWLALAALIETIRTPGPDHDH